MLGLLLFRIQQLVQCSLQDQKYAGNLPSSVYRHSNESILFAGSDVRSVATTATKLKQLLIFMRITHKKVLTIF